MLSNALYDIVIYGDLFMTCGCMCCIVLKVLLYCAECTASCCIAVCIKTQAPRLHCSLNLIYFFEKPLKFGNQASTKSSTLIDWSSKSLQHILAGIGALLAVLVISGMIMERFLKKSKMPPEFSSMNFNFCLILRTNIANLYIVVLYIKYGAWTVIVNEKSLFITKIQFRHLICSKLQISNLSINIEQFG